MSKALFIEFKYDCGDINNEVEIVDFFDTKWSILDKEGLIKVDADSSRQSYQYKRKDDARFKIYEILEEFNEFGFYVNFNSHFSCHVSVQKNFERVCFSVNHPHKQMDGFPATDLGWYLTFLQDALYEYFHQPPYAVEIDNM